MNNVFYKDDPEYPELLRRIGKEAPKQLYFKGSCPEFSSRFTLKGSDASRKIQSVRSKQPSIFENCLAVVGSRRLTSYGQRIAQDLVEELAMAGLTIVSGFMYGGDAAAHQATVKVGGRTIAIMPCGIERINPEYQKNLYDEILKNNGLIISEYQGDSHPALWTYPQRNRIVAGLSKAVLVLEAGAKSGSLITASYAKKFKRKIFAVPGSIISSMSKGTNLLIKEGAEVVTEAKDVLEYYDSHSDSSDPGFSSRFIPLKREPYAFQKFRNPRLGELEKQIIKELGREPLGIDELSRNLEISISELGAKLSFMQIQGLISQTGNKYYINNK